MSLRERGRATNRRTSLIVPLVAFALIMSSAGVQEVQAQLPGTINLNVPPGSEASPVMRAYGDQVDGELSSVAIGDINGDGYDDVIVGSPLADRAGMANVGEVAVVFGNPTRPASTSNLLRGGTYVAFASTDLPKPINSGSTTISTISVPTSSPIVRVSVIGLNITFPYDQYLDIKLEAPSGTVVSLSSGNGGSNYTDTNFDDGAITSVIGASAPYTGTFIPQGALLSLVGQNASGDWKLKVQCSGYSGSLVSWRLEIITQDSLTSAEGETRILGDDANERFGSSLAIGDVNGDGVDDIIVGAPGPGMDGKPGKVYVISGSPGLPGTVVDLNTDGAISVAGETRIVGDDANDQAGFSVSSGDVNADGFDDVIIGAPRGDGYGNANPDAGELYIVYGGPALARSVLDLSRPMGTYGETRIFGDDQSDLAGYSVATGDLNGDGFKDVMIGIPYGDYYTDSGEVDVIYGQQSLPGTVINLDTNGYISASGETRIYGPDSYDYAGWSVASGDVNGDGFDDVIIGAPSGDGASNAGTDRGEAYVIYGKATLPATSVYLYNAVGYYSETRIWGDDASDNAGYAVACGDVNGDGLDDVIVGAIKGDAAGDALVDAGEMYVLYGSSSRPGTNVDLSSTPGDVRILGAKAGDRFGSAATTGGDVNQDGFGDFAGAGYLGDNPLIGGPNDSGFAVAVFGAGTSSTATHVRRSRAGNTPASKFGPSVRASLRFADGAVASQEAVVLTRSHSGITNLGDGSLSDVANVRWQVSTTRTGFSSATIAVKYTEAEIIGLDECSLVLYQAPAPSGPWTTVSGQSLDPIRNRITGTLGSFSSVFLAITGAAPGTASYVQFARSNVTTVGEKVGRVRLAVALNKAAGVGGASVQYTVTGGTATGGGVDYTLLWTGTLTFAQGQEVGFVELDIIDDAIAEPDETVTLALSNPVGVFLSLCGPVTSTLTIVSDDQPGVLVTPTDHLWTTEAGGQASLTVSLKSKPVADVTIHLVSTAPAEGVPDVASLIFDGTNWHVPRTVTVTGVNDGIIDGNFVYSIVMSATSLDANYNAISIPALVLTNFANGLLPPIVDLNTIPGTEAAPALRVYGDDAGDGLGSDRSKAIAHGDVNGDGIADLIIGAPYASQGGRAQAGEVYVIYGTNTAPSSVVDLNTNGLIGAHNETRILGDRAGDQFGVSVATGDVNGDGIDDIIVGARWADPPGGDKAGEVFVIYGGTGLPGTIVDLNTNGSISPHNETRILGEDAYDEFGYAVTTGDVNGDGYADVIVGAPGGDGKNNAISSAGEVYIIYGRAALPGNIIDLNTGGTVGADEARILGDDGFDRAGSSLACGDINGDGLDDILIGVPQGDGANNALPDAGEAVVIYGSPSLRGTTVDLNTNGAIAAAQETRIFGDNAGDKMGISVACGDVNGDGFSDAIIGAYNGGAGSGGGSGEAYVVYGSSSIRGSVINLDTDGVISVAHETRILGDDAADQAGISVGAGDLNGDGFDDIILGASLADGASNTRVDAGEVDVVYGSSSLPSTIVDLHYLEGDVRIFGAKTGDHFGSSVDAGGDLNLDGFSDIAASAFYGDNPSIDSTTTNNSGYVATVFAQGNAMSATRIMHTQAGDAPISDFGPIVRAKIDFAAGVTTSTETVTLTRSSEGIQNLGDGTGSDLAKVFWRFSTNRSGFGSARVVLKYLDGEVTGLSEATLTLYQASTPSGPWTVVPSQSVNVARNEISGMVSGSVYLSISSGVPRYASADFNKDGYVNQSDLEHFEGCATGPAIAPPASGCEDADLDGDHDVDQDDFAIYQRCFSATNTPANADCAR